MVYVLVILQAYSTSCVPALLTTLTTHHSIQELLVECVSVHSKVRNAKIWLQNQHLLPLGWGLCTINRINAANKMFERFSSIAN